MTSLREAWVRILFTPGRPINIGVRLRSGKKEKGRPTGVGSCLIGGVPPRWGGWEKSDDLCSLSKKAVTAEGNKHVPPKSL